jgi:hypothetical protein
VHMAEVVGPGVSPEELQDLNQLGQACGTYLDARRSGRVNDMEDALLHIEILTEEYMKRWYPQKPA